MKTKGTPRLHGACDLEAWSTAAQIEIKHGMGRRLVFQETCDSFFVRTGSEDFAARAAEGSGSIAREIVITEEEAA